MILAQRTTAILREFGEKAKTHANSAAPRYSEQLANYINFHSSMRQLSKLENIFTLDSKSAPIEFLINFYQQQKFDDFRLIDDCNGIFQPIFINNFTWSVITVCGSMLTIQIVKYLDIHSIYTMMSL